MQPVTPLANMPQKIQQNIQSPVPQIQKMNPSMQARPGVSIPQNAQFLPGIVPNDPLDYDEMSLPPLPARDQKKNFMP